jgi:CBS domain-containing protein
MVAEVMTRNVQSVSPSETVRRAAQLMDNLNVGALPVCDGDKLVGMVTDRDITVRATSAGMAPDDAVVDQVMSTDVRCCFEDQSIDEVMRQMADTQIRRVPVVSHDEARRLVGILSLGDIVTKAAVAARPEDIEQVMQKVSFPSEPDRSTQEAGNGGSGGDGGSGGGGPAASDGSHTSIAAGLAGSDVLADRMNPGVEVSSTADPSDMVEVTPDKLVNRNAPGSRIANQPDGADKPQQEGVVVRHTVASGADSSTGESGAPGGTDVAGASGASGGTAGTSGSAGSGVGAGP